MTKHTNTPELRFPEFKDIWYIKQLEEIGTFKNGINKDKNSFGHGFPFINLNDVFNQDNININNLGLIDSSEKEREEYNLTKGDTLFIRSSVKPSGVGLTKVIQNDLINTVYSGFLIRFRERKKFLEDNFKSYIFSSTSVRKQIISLSSTSANTNINQDSLKKVQIVIPPLIEQAKIGIFFNKLDRQIELEEEKLELLEQQKRGYMQKIFSQELRFQDENEGDYPNWKKITIKEVANLTAGKSKKNENKGKYIIMDMGTVTKNGTMLTHKSTPYESDLLNKGDLVMPKDDIGGGHIIGKTVFIPESHKYVLGDHVYRLEIKNCNSLFLHYYINSDIVNRSLKRKVTGSAQLGLNRKSVEEEVIKTPCLEEQGKIGNLFNKIDNLIELQIDKIELLKQRKQGLLQKMFV